MNCCKPLSRINGRLLIFLVIVALPFCWFGWQLASEAVNGGIHRQGDVTLVDLKTLGHFNFDRERSTIDDVPPRFRALDGQRVVLEGFMYSDDRAGRASDFQLVYNVNKCCFDGPPRVQERVFVHSETPQVIDISRYVQMTGTLHVKVHRNEVGSIDSVYTLELENVKYRVM